MEHLEMRMTADYFWFWYSNHEHSLGILLAARFEARFLPSVSYNLRPHRFVYGNDIRAINAISHSSLIMYIYEDRVKSRAIITMT